eukprot:365139-Amphidinium_carterae.1
MDSAVPDATGALDGFLEAMLTGRLHEYTRSRGRMASICIERAKVEPVPKSKIARKTRTYYIADAVERFGLSILAHRLTSDLCSVRELSYELKEAGWPPARDIWKVTGQLVEGKLTARVERTAKWRSLPITGRWKGNNHAEPTPSYLSWHSDSYRWLVVECIKEGTALHTANGLALQELPPVVDGDSMTVPCVLARGELDRLMSLRDTVISLKDFESEWDEAQAIKAFGYETVTRPGASSGGADGGEATPESIELLESTCWLETDSAVWDVSSPSWIEPMSVSVLQSIAARRNGTPDIGTRQRGLALSEEERQAIRFIVSRACRREVLLTDARVSVIA